MQVRDHRAGGDPLAPARYDAGGAALLDENLADCRVGADFDPPFGAGPGHRLGDRAHAADRVAPLAPPAVYLAPAMMQEHVARARGVGAGVGSDDTIEAEDRLDRIALEPLVEDIAGRAGEELHEIALPFEPKRPQAVSDFGCIEEGAEIGGDPLSGRQIGGRLERKRAQGLGQALKPRLVRREPARRRGRRIFRLPLLCAPGRP